MPGRPPAPEPPIISAASAATAAVPAGEAVSMALTTPHAALRRSVRLDRHERAGRPPVEIE